MFGLTFEKLLIIGIIAALLIGPDRLPHLASQLANFVKAAKRMAESGRERLRDEVGDEVDDIDWRNLDPRRYDPRRIVRDAVSSAFDDEEKKERPKPPPPSSRYRPPQRGEATSPPAAPAPARGEEPPASNAA
jgi:sec-independent protein translocase protein TatB